MGVRLFNIPYYTCTCDNCREQKDVTKNPKIYNSAQAARSLGWSFGRDGKTFCKKCRKNNHNDHYKWNV